MREKIKKIGSIFFVLMGLVVGNLIYFGMDIYRGRFYPDWPLSEYWPIKMFLTIVGCVFQSKAATRFGGIRPGVSEESGHLFRLKAATLSAA